jgi:hypothetical protein
VSWFRRKSGPSAADRLHGRWRCAGCNEEHDGLAHLAAFAPDPWRGDEIREENGALRLDGDFLSEDFCVIDGKYFLIRGVLEIPIHGSPEPFGFGCWSTLSRQNFDKYIAGFDDGAYPDMGPWSGWLCNQLEDYIGADPLALWVYPQLDRQRPRLRIQNVSHPLALDQANGITPERALEIFAHYGHAPVA